MCSHYQETRVKNCFICWAFRWLLKASTQQTSFHLWVKSFGLSLETKTMQQFRKWHTHTSHPSDTPMRHPHASHQKGTPTWHAHTLHPSAVREMGFRKRSLTKNPFSSFRYFFSSLFHPTFSFSLCLLVSTSLCLNCYPLSLLVSAILSCFKIDLYLTTPCLPISNLHILFYTFFSTPHLTPNILSILNH